MCNYKHGEVFDVQLAETLYYVKPLSHAKICKKVKVHMSQDPHGQNLYRFCSMKQA